jgi:hypothetical protein
MQYLGNNYTMNNWRIIKKKTKKRLEQQIPLQYLNERELGAWVGDVKKREEAQNSDL